MGREVDEAAFAYDEGGEGGVYCFEGLGGIRGGGEGAEVEGVDVVVGG